MNAQTKQIRKNRKFLTIVVIMLLLLAAIPTMAETELNEADFQVGNYVTFGTYPQTAEGTDETPIEWLVLNREGDKALLISKYALDAKAYNDEDTDITWENCTLRKWLNNDFYNKAFSEEEQQYIIESTVTADANPKHETDPGNDTTDKIFFLSINEFNAYFTDNEARLCYLTDYAVNQGAYSYSINEGACWWWLRSPGHYSILASYVDCEGSVYDYGGCVNNSRYSVRPAIRVQFA